jgi:hypothetical protein
MQNNTVCPNITNYSNPQNIIQNVPNVVNNMTHMVKEGESIFNKTCNEVSNRLIGETNLVNKNSVLSTNDILQTNQLGINVQNAGNAGNAGNVENLGDVEMMTLSINTTKSQYYNILGYEFSIWTLILILLILITIIYLIYRWFFTSDNQIVTMKKSKQIIKSINSKDKEKLNQEISDSEDSSGSESESESGNKSKSSSKSKISNKKK